MSNTARHIARQKLRELAKYIQKNEQVDTISGLLQRLGMKDLVIAQFEANLRQLLTEREIYGKLIDAARDVVDEYNPEDANYGTLRVEVLDNLKVAFKEFDKFFVQEEEKDGTGESDPNPVGETEGEETSAAG